MAKIDWKLWDLVISPSQVETWADCVRKWFFEKIARLPSLDKGFQIFGQVVHQVAERYHEADDLGRVPSPVPESLKGQKAGDPVDLFPPEWEVAHSRFGAAAIMGRVSPREAAQIRKLVEKAIEEGIWTRQPGRQTEFSFLRKVIDRVAMVGYIDLLMPGVIVDHKSAKNLRYAKTREELEEDTQMLSYAWNEFARMDELGTPLQEVELRHNVFSKDTDNPVVRATSGFTERGPVEEFIEEVRGVARDMLKLKRSGANIDNWQTIPGADEHDPGVCKKYGGCDFAGICGRVETPKDYIARIERAQKAQAEGAQALTQTTGDSNVSIFDKMNKRTAGASTPATPPAPESAPNPAPAKVAEVHPEVKQLHPEQQPAPWARPGCKKCNALGLNIEGQPCGVCKAFAKKDGRPHPDTFDLGTDAEGRITWTAKDGSSAGGTEVVAEPKVKDTTGAEGVSAPAKEAAPAATETAPAEPAAEAPAKAAKGSSLARRRNARSKAKEAAPAATEPAPASTDGDSGSDDSDDGKGKPGRKKQGFTLLINCLPELPKTTGIINLHQVWGEACAALAKAMEVEGQEATFYDLHAMKRRDWLNSRVRQIVSGFGSKQVVATGPFSPDFLEFLEAVKSTPECGFVFRGVH